MIFSPTTTPYSKTYAETSAMVQQQNWLEYLGSEYIGLTSFSFYCIWLMEEIEYGMLGELHMIHSTSRKKLHLVMDQLWSGVIAHTIFWNCKTIAKQLQQPNESGSSLWESWHTLLWWSSIGIRSYIRGLQYLMKENEHFRNIYCTTPLRLLPWLARSPDVTLKKHLLGV